MPRGFGGRGFGGRGFGMRRMGGPIIMGGGMGGFGSPLLTSLMAGGLGYTLGSNNAQSQQPPVPYQPPQPVIAPMYPPPPYQYQWPSPSPAVTPDATNNSLDSAKLAQLQLLGKLRDSGVLTNDEFEREKQQILGI